MINFIKIAFIIRAVFFAPLIVMDREPIGHCVLIHVRSDGLVMIPHCVDRDFEWSGSWIW